MKVCILGLGQVGLPTASYVKERGLEVIGYDINGDAIERARKQGVRSYGEWKDVAECDIYIVCVSTSMNRGKPDLSAIYDALAKVAERLTDMTLVSVESTIPVGTCREAFGNILGNRGLLVHVPHRYWEGDTKNYGVRQRRVIGGVNHKSILAGLSFYSDVLDVPLHKVPSIETAEMCKITENAYRFLQIAFAEELRMICEELGLEFDEVRNACNTKWNIEIVEARKGIGGHCLPKDTRYFSLLSRASVIPAAAIEADRRYKSWLVAGKGRL